MSKGNLASSIEPAVLAWHAESAVLQCSGAFTVAGIAKIDQKYTALLKNLPQELTVQADALTELDTAGALLLYDILHQLNENGAKVTFSGLTDQQQNLFNTIEKEWASTQQLPRTLRAPNFFYQLGQFGYSKYIELVAFLQFIGEFTVSLIKALIPPIRIPIGAIFRAMDDTGYQALPILALMSFLIGVVLSYELALQLKIFGANIFIVDITGMAVLREFSPLITAVILAGRTSTSFAALLGTMKVNEEIDALLIMGISPMERLVIPRVIGLFLAFPLLIVWSDIFGVFGSMVMAKSQLSVSYQAYFERFQYEVSVRQYVLGLIKAPVFALIIAGVGCFQGFCVGDSAESVGRQTTKAAVQAIFMIIIADSLFAIIYSWLDL